MRRSCSLLVTAAAEIVDAGEIRNGRVFRSLLRPVILARLIGDSDQGLGVLTVALEELHEFRRRSWRRQHGLLLEILDEFRLPIERHELGIEPVHGRLRHSAWGANPHQPKGGKSMPASARVGISGTRIERRAAATASGLILPVPKSPRKFPSPILATWSSPATRACAIGPPPR